MRAARRPPSTLLFASAMAAASRAPAGTAGITKWHHYWSAAEPPPWESGAPASQLVAHARAVPLSGLRCAELCCGSGANSVFMAEAGAARVVGVDLVPRAIALANERAAALTPAARSSLRFVVGDVLGPAEALGLPELAADGQFDFVFDCQGFHCLRESNGAAAARAIARLLRPGGRLLSLCGRQAEDEEEPPEGDEGQPRRCGPPRLSREEAIAAFEEHGGLELVSIAPGRFDTTPAYSARGPPCWVAMLRKPSSSRAAAMAPGADELPRVPAGWAARTTSLELLCSPRESADATAAALAAHFGHLPRVSVVRADIRTLEFRQPRSALITPANTRCCMGGGFDASVAARLGWPAGWPESPAPNPLQVRVRDSARPGGSDAGRVGGGYGGVEGEQPAEIELPIGQAIAVPLAPGELQAKDPGLTGLCWLIASPTMALPAAPLPSAEPVRVAMRAAMAEARKVDAELIVCPSFGTGWGGLSSAEASRAMLKGFEEAWSAKAQDGDD